MNRPSTRAVKAHMKNKEPGFPRVGVAVIIQRDNRVLLGQRGPASKRGAGTWSLPGGAMDFGETFIETAMRELLEETGLVLLDPGVGAYSACVFENEHWITFFVDGTVADGAEPERTEPEKCSSWEWLTSGEMNSRDLFAPLVTFREKYNWF